MTRRREISASAAVCCSHSRAAPQKKRGAATFRGPPIPRSLPPPSRKPLPAPTLPDVSAPLGSTGLRRTCLAPHDRRADARRRRSARRVPPKTMRRSIVTDAARRCGVSGCREARPAREVLASVNPARSRDRMSRTLASDAPFCQLRWACAPGSRKPKNTSAAPAKKIQRRRLKSAKNCWHCRKASHMLLAIIMEMS
jgi:hypothetical protein